VGRELAAGYELGAAAETVKLAGSLRGFARAARLPLVDGHFRSPDHAGAVPR
jgi:hypothetical protein